jgi:hypothetical protein
MPWMRSPRLPPVKVTAWLASVAAVMPSSSAAFRWRTFTSLLTARAGEVLSELFSRRAVPPAVFVSRVGWSARLIWPRMRLFPVVAKVA